jgi:hypothetical protein
LEGGSRTKDEILIERKTLSIKVDLGKKKHISSPETRTQIVIDIDPEVAKIISGTAIENGLTMEDMAAVYLTFATGAFVLPKDQFELVSTIVGISIAEHGLPVR